MVSRYYDPSGADTPTPLVPTGGQVGDAKRDGCRRGTRSSCARVSSTGSHHRSTSPQAGAPRSTSYRWTSSSSSPSISGSVQPPSGGLGLSGPRPSLGVGDDPDETEWLECSVAFLSVIPVAFLSVILVAFLSVHLPFPESSVLSFIETFSLPKEGRTGGSRGPTQERRSRVTGRTVLIRTLTSPHRFSDNRFLEWTLVWMGFPGSGGSPSRWLNLVTVIVTHSKLFANVIMCLSLLYCSSTIIMLKCWYRTRTPCDT